MNRTTEQIETLQRLLLEIGPMKVAVSGGVDSVTLGLLAERALGSRVLICHAVSPAVPAEATERVRGIAEKEDWRLRILNAGEFADPNYLHNPYDRCFHCKNNLYAAMARVAEIRQPATLLSGANLDDLDDYRPGLMAANQHGVRHPFVECGITKSAVRAIAERLGYTDLSGLPASPCLSSRIETGLPIRAGQLAFVQRVERRLRESLRPTVVRCRVTADGIAIQLDTPSLERLHGAQGRWRSKLEQMAQREGLPGSVRFEPYRMGSAFVAPK